MKQILLAIFLFATGLSFGQSFEGTLTYTCNIEVSKDLEKMGMTKEMLIEKMKQDGSYADVVSISYKQGNYCQLFNNNPNGRTFYKAETNKIYALVNGESSDICTVTDASIDLEYNMTGKKPTIEKLDTVAIVNGVSCSVVRVKWNAGTYDYYYNSAQFKVDPSLFAKHIYDGWADFLKISGALPLKIVKGTNGMMTITMTLTASKAETVDEKLFTIPTLVADANLNLVKLPNREVMRVKK